MLPLKSTCRKGLIKQKLIDTVTGLAEQIDKSNVSLSRETSIPSDRVREKLLGQQRWQGPCLCQVSCPELVGSNRAAGRSLMVLSALLAASKQVLSSLYLPWL